MTKMIVPVAVLAVLGASIALASGPPPPNATVSISLPGDAGFAFKSGPGAESAQRYCLGCHSSAYVSTQPAFSHAQWTAEVLKMRTAYGATIPDDQVEPIATYLTTSYGKRE